MAKRIAITVDEDMHELLTKLSELRGASISLIAGEILDEYRNAWALELAKWTVARRREDEAAREIEALRAERKAEGAHAYTGKGKR